MSNLQFFTALGLPILVMLIGFHMQNTGIRDLGTEMVQLRGDVKSEINQFRSEVNARFLGIDQRFADLTGKVVEIDNRLTRVEERLKL